MKRKAHPTRIGLFMLGALALLVAAVVVVSGGRVFAQREHAVAYFEGSVYGLQLGAPVVFRGVRLGSVVGIGVVYQGQPGRYAIPVELQIESDAIADAGAPGARAPTTVADLVSQGLSAQLSTQSLLTGLLYVDLDLRNDARAVGSLPVRKSSQGLIEIPTMPTALQSLQKQLQQVDLKQLLGDVSAVAAGLRQLVGNPRLAGGVDELAQAGSELRQLLAQLNRRVGPLDDALRGTLGSTRQTADRWGTAVGGVGAAVDRVGQAADRVSGTMGRFDKLADDAAPALNSVRRAADDLASTAAALRKATSEDSALMQQVERAAQDMARASRAVRDLADLLERQPEALIRGRSANP